MVKTTTYTLVHPITLGAADAARTFTVVTLREPDVDALEAIEELGITEGKAPSVKQLRGIIAAISDLPNEAVGKMHRDDFIAIGEQIAPLLDPDQTEPAP